jgi:hypothetical protein
VAENPPLGSTALPHPFDQRRMVVGVGEEHATESIL